MKKIVFLTATRAEFGKMKTLMQAVENHKNMECYIFVTGMHMLKKYGSTYLEIEKLKFKNIFKIQNQNNKDLNMEVILAKTINIFSKYIRDIKPDLIVIHGDRLEALAGAIVGAFTNTKVAHIEGGEVSGTIDESIRHAVTKFSHFHFVSNKEAKRRIIQLGENKKNIEVIGSPDIDVMLSKNLPDINFVKKYYEINFNNYGVFMFHPVVTDLKNLPNQIKLIINTLIKSNKQYVVIFPNNDSGTEIIQKEITRLKNNPNFKVFPSIRFEYFLVLLKNADFLIGNSSAGVRETCIYGIPSIDLGNRQEGRYDIKKIPNIIHPPIIEKDIIKAIGNVNKYRKKSMIFGKGNSTKKFMELLETPEFWKIEIQKRFVDFES